MNTERFSFIDEWEEENDEIQDLHDKESISSEESTDGVMNEEIHQFFHRKQNSHAIWNNEEIENTLKEPINSVHIMKMINLGSFEGLTPNSNDVHVALLLSTWYNGDDNVVNLIENFMANVNFTDSRGRTPLHFACSNGNAHLSKILLDKGANPNSWDRYNKATPLHCAASAGSIECILLLLKRKAHINVGLEKRSPLHFAIDKNAIECVEVLLKYGADPNTPQVFTETPLHTACALGHKKCVELLLNYGADVRSQFGKRKLTALHLAAEDNYADCVQLLLEKKETQIDARNADYQTPLHMACLSQCIETVELLIKYGANVNVCYRDGRTALHAAIVKQSRCVECVRILLKSGAKVNKADYYGYTPLHMAALHEYGPCVNELIQNGADITARTNGGISALSFIVRRTPEIIPKLITKLDTSIKVNDHEIGDVDCEIKLDFRLLVPSTERGESEMLMTFIEAGQKRILTHPLCETFLFLKWRRIRKFFLMSLFYHALYVLMFTLYVLGVYVNNCEKCKPSSYVSPIGYFVVLLNLALLGREFFEMGHGLNGYARYWENWLQWTIILGVFLCVTPETLKARDGNLKLEDTIKAEDETLYTVPTWQHHVAAIVVFLVWLELMMLVGRFPIFGLYVQMFTKVAVNFGKFLLAYCCLLIAFGLSFCVLFTNYPAFEYIPWSLLKVITMMSGELEFEDIFYNSEDHPIQYPVTSHILFLSFVLLVTVILTNLLVGLAVSDIQGLQVSAGLDRLIRQAELVSRLEGLFFSRLLTKAPPKLLAICQRNALLRTSRYQLQFITKPNDPRDKQLPEDLKMNIFKLVAERRDRNQSIHRQKFEYNYNFFQKNYMDNQVDKSITEDEVLLRPKTILPRTRILSETTKNQKSSSIKSESIDLKIVERQLNDITEKMDKFNDIFLRKLFLCTEELARIKMQLDRI